MKKEKIIGIILLTICTVIWGAAFSFQTMAKDEIGPFSLIAIRFIIAGVVLTPIVWIYVKAKKITIHKHLHFSKPYIHFPHHPD